MRVLVDITHPAHVHFFKHAIWLWQQREDKVIITARDKDLTIELLDQYGFSYTNLGAARQGVLGVGWELLTREWQLYSVIRKTKPDVLTAISGAFMVHAGKLMDIPIVVFVDTEHARLSHWISFPFATSINTPVSFRKDLGRKQCRYKGYHELAYLHPNRFTPSPSILTDLGLNPTEPFFIVRFVAWGAHHDVGQRGFSDSEKRSLVGMLLEHGQVILTSEEESVSKLIGLNRPIPPNEIHNLLHYATMYVGEGGTMATEAALLGTPSIFVSTLTGGNWEDLEHKYHLLYTFREGEAAIEKVHELLAVDNLKETWRSRQERLLADKIDVTQFIMKVVERAATGNGRKCESASQKNGKICQR